MRFSKNAASIKRLSLSETMHSAIGAEQEAHLIYVQQSKLKERTSDPVVIYDVGMGVAANAIAALECPTPGKKIVVSFENDLDGMRYLLRNPEGFNFIKTWAPAIEELLETGKWQSSSAEWVLRPGDFLEQDFSGLPEPEIIFYDFYSPKTSPELWTVGPFKKLFDHTEQRRASGLQTNLYTYCAARAARDAMKEAGFYVYKGTNTPIKRETTFTATLAPCGALNSSS